MSTSIDGGPLELQLGQGGGVTASAWEGGGDARVVQVAQNPQRPCSPTGSALLLGSLPLTQAGKLQQLPYEAEHFISGTPG